MGDPVKAFLRLAGSLDYPLFIVTTAHGERRAGCIIGFATQTSFEPARFLACLSRENRTFRVALEGPALAVHLIPRARLDLVELFGAETGDEVDKFERCAWHRGPRDLPILDDCPSWFAGDVIERFDLGDHVGFLLAPQHGAHEPGESLYFQRAKHVEPGHPA